MKTSTLLTQFLYQHKHLEIPGIGRFSIPDAVSIPESTDKTFPDFLQTIEFNRANSPKPSDELIDFIRSKTGKIKPLAESDLESYLSDCKTILNIGKPLYLEGIGTLQKNKEGRYDFAHGQAASERLESQPSEHHTVDKPRDKKPLYNTEYTGQATQSNALRRVLILAGIVIGMGVIVWGGYLLYSKKTNNTVEVSEAVPQAIAETTSLQQPSADTLQSSTIDSSTLVTPVSNPIVSSSGSYKFICEYTKTRNRAMTWFPQLKLMDNRYQMTTTDSVRFKIFVTLNVPPADTTRIKDSLRLWYWGNRDRLISIEQ